MEASSRSGMSMSAHFNLLTATASIVPLLATLCVGWFAIYQPISGIDPQTLMWTVTLAAAALGLMAVILAVIRMRWLMRDYAGELTEVCRQAVSGNRAARLAVVGDDEYAMLSNTVNKLVMTASGAGGAAKTAATIEAPDAVILQGQIEKLLTEVSAVGDGDLRVQAEVTPDTLGVLADSFNFMIEELAKVVGRVQATTNQVSTATRRLLDRSANVAQSSEAQARQISLVSERVAELADFVQLSAKNALQAAVAASEAIQSSRDGQASVVKTTEGMAHIRENVQETSKKIKRLGERSQEVGEIVRLIEDIAEQTNLLALNAAIQSAMAGEHGRGFHVVADEIRILAERVAEATKRVGAIVKTIQGDTYEAVVAMEESTQEVIEGSRLADDAGRALQRIYSAVDRQAQMINDIAHGANERRQVAETVAVAMGQIAEVTRQTNSTTQDTMTAVSYLAELAEQLRASVAAFRLPDQMAEGAGLPQGVEPPHGPPMAPPLMPQSMSQSQASWYPGPDAFPALPAGPIQASYVEPRNAFDVGAYDATWTEAPQQDPTGYALPNFDQMGYDQTGYGQNGQNGYPGEQYPSSPLGNYPFPTDRGQN
ncbi:MAG TPA: methyl-accepting chemotaxis protein [Ktedonobacterales bacterium]|nr:methyl-accepting chemotaxis protein [Ktedonobacterales bacterium]